MSEDQDYLQLQNRVIALFCLNRPKEVIPLLTKTLEIEPGNLFALCCLSSAYGDLGQWFMALHYANMAIQANPDSEWGYRRRSMCLESLNQNESALVAAVESVRLAPDFPFAILQLASIQGECGRWEESEQTTIRLLELAPDWVYSHIQMGLVHLKRNHYKKSIECNRAALALDPESTAALINLGLALEHLGQNQDALNHFHLALQRDPSDNTAHSNFNRVIEKCGYVSTDEYLVACKAPRLAPRSAQSNALVEKVKGFWRAVSTIFRSDRRE